MKLKVKKDKLLKALQKVTNIIGNRSTLPVLANILFEAEGSTLTLTATDLELRIKTSIEATIEKEGKTTIRAKKLLSLVTKFIGDDVIMDCNENHHTRIECGTAKFTLLGLASDDFPVPVDFVPIRKMKFKEMELSRILDQISYAVSLDDSRKVLHGILFSMKENTLTSVATDGKRLALVEKILDEGTSGSDGDSIIPLKSANEIKRLLEKDGEVSIELGEKQASFVTASFKLTTKLIEGNYPNYRQVIPPSFGKFIDIPRELFIAKLELVSIALADSSAFIKLCFDNNTLSFKAASTDVGEGNDYIEIPYTDTKIDISFNPDFLADPFRHSAADKVVLKMNDGFSPVAIEGGEGFLYVIMPMRNK
ncbi:MAG: DNA polymerase III subunit beta [Lentisphaerae bacterium GWF2_45_14]|nr:MAG: DNA polymerase III subunit beta [Lentisphaerae bacterium GWF2_45_14]